MENLEDRLARLEALSEKIRDRDVPLKEAMDFFTEGAELSRKIEKELQGWERKVEILSNESPEEDEGDPQFRPFQD